MKKTMAVIVLGVGYLFGMMSAQAAGKLTVTKDGQEVIDQAQGLVWRRCAEGMNWNGRTCVGEAAKVPHANAQEIAQRTAKTTGKAWRLPTLAELESIVDGSRNNPAIDDKLFPATPSMEFWTGLVVPDDANEAWVVGFNMPGISTGDYRGSHYAVRLVRSGRWQ